MDEEGQVMDDRYIACLSPPAFEAVQCYDLWGHWIAIEIAPIHVC